MIGAADIQKIGYVLVNACRQTNADRMKLSLTGVTDKEESIGDWDVIVEKKGIRKWLVWSNEHRAYWGPGHSGYVEKRSEAGRYTYEEAVKIVYGANRYRKDEDFPFEAMILDEEPDNDEE